MVELAGEDSPFKQSVDNSVLLVAAGLVALVFGYLAYRMVSSLKEKEKAKEDKRLAKQAKKEKASAGSKKSK